MTPTPPIFVVDANSIAHVGYYGVARRDPPTAILGAITNSEQIARELNHPTIFWAFDAKPYHRTKFYPGYKFNRAKPGDDFAADLAEEFKKVLSEMPDYLRQLGYRNIFRYTGYEADDHVAAVTLAFPRIPITIYSRDHDLFQLLSKWVTIYDPVKRVTHSGNNFRNTMYDIHPLELVELKAIAGCPSDAIKGAEGIGESTALRYLSGEKLRGGRKWKGTDMQQIIAAFVQSPEYERNIRLIRLPWEGTPIPTFTPDEPRPDGAWQALCEKLNRPGMIELGNEKQWRKTT